MKKFFYIFCIFIFFTSISYGKYFSLAIGTSYWWQEDKAFKQIYDNKLLLYEIKSNINFYGDYYFWAAYSRAKKTGTSISILNEETNILYNCFSGGLGFTEKFMKNLNYKVEIGLSFLKFKEQALGLESKDSKLGFRAETGIAYNFFKQVSLEIFLGYMGASKSEDLSSFKMGGLRAGLGLLINL